MYVALQGDDKLARFTLDPTTGKLTPQGEVAVPGGPAYPTGGRSAAAVFICRTPWRLYHIEFSYRTAHRGLDTDWRGSAGIRPLLHSHRSEQQVFVVGILPGWQSRSTSMGTDGAASGPPVEWRDTARGAHCMQTDPSGTGLPLCHTLPGTGPMPFFCFVSTPKRVV